jgi:hypothetical protein
MEMLKVPVTDVVVVPSTRTVNRILIRRGLLRPRPRKRPRESYRRWERPGPRQLWQVDIVECGVAPALSAPAWGKGSCSLVVAGVGLPVGPTRSAGCDVPRAEWATPAMTRRRVHCAPMARALPTRRRPPASVRLPPCARSLPRQRPDDACLELGQRLPRAGGRRATVSLRCPGAPQLAPVPWKR